MGRPRQNWRRGSAVRVTHFLPKHPLRPVLLAVQPPPKQYLPVGTRVLERNTGETGGESPTREKPVPPRQRCLRRHNWGTGCREKNEVDDPINDMVR